MILVNTKEEFGRYVPNILKAVQGEASVFEKTRASLERSEQWLANTFVPLEMLDGLTEVRDIAAHIVVLDAFHDIVPSLDLILTPNGFGIVNNTNVVPASKERIDRLRATLIADRDKYIDLLLRELSAIAEWRNTEQGRYFGGTLFPNLYICGRVQNGDIQFRGGVWEKYLWLRNKIIGIESELEAAYFSEEQMQVFRQEVQAGTVTETHQIVISKIIAYITGVLSGTLAQHLLTDAVDIIRKDEASFPEWHASPVKELFNPVVFQNKKENRGYWF